MQILFYDVVTPTNYTQLTLLQTGLGGTEATITRIAHGLKEHCTVYVAQHCRQTEHNCVVNGVHYLSLESANQLQPDIVILLRSSAWLEKVAQLFPKAKRYFWLHNMPSKSLFRSRALLEQHQYEVIGVSRFHQTAIERRLHGKWFQRVLKKKQAKIPVHFIHNPIDEGLKPDGTVWNPNQLILASSPYKGLQHSLKMFSKVSAHFPEYELLIATYATWDKNIKLPPRTKFLGSLPHSKLLQHVRESFCLFYPQPVRCETFGLVYAESNAVGTPVIAHDFGAASEVLSDSCQLVNGFKADSVIKKIKEWRESRPNIVSKPEFRLGHIVQKWLALIKT